MTNPASPTEPERCPECILESCPDCGRPRAPCNLCDADSIYDDGQCPSLTITRLRAELASVRALSEDLPQLEACADLVLKLHQFGPTVTNRNRVALLGEWVEVRNAALRKEPADDGT